MRFPDEQLLIQVDNKWKWQEWKGLVEEMTSQDFVGLNI